MNFEWDENKRITNLKKHGVDFVAASRLWNSPMLVVEDTRSNYQEQRWLGMGLLEKRVMIIVYTKRRNTIRIISFRKANKREVKYYEKAFS